MKQKYTKCHHHIIRLLSATAYWRSFSSEYMSSQKKKPERNSSDLDTNFSDIIAA